MVKRVAVIKLFDYYSYKVKRKALTATPDRCAPMRICEQKFNVDEYADVLPLLKDLLEDAEPVHRDGIRRSILAIDMILAGLHGDVPAADIKELHDFMDEVADNDASI